jgi:integrase
LIGLRGLAPNRDRGWRWQLCALKKADVLKLKDGYWLVIPKGKTEAAAREVPIRPSIKHILDRRRLGSGEYLFGRSRRGAYGRRSHHVSKAYRRYREMVGVAARGQDFHALRHTFADMMEGAEVPGDHLDRRHESLRAIPVGEGCDAASKKSTKTAFPGFATIVWRRAPRIITYSTATQELLRRAIVVFLLWPISN